MLKNYSKSILLFTLILISLSLINGVNASNTENINILNHAVSDTISIDNTENNISTLSSSQVDNVYQEIDNNAYNSLDDSSGNNYENDVSTVTTQKTTTFNSVEDGINSTNVKKLNSQSNTLNFDNELSTYSQNNLNLLTSIPDGTFHVVNSNNDYNNFNDAYNNATINGDTIIIGSGTYIGSTNIGLTISKNITIKADTNAQVTFDGVKSSRILTIDTAYTVILNGINFINGSTTPNSGAIYNQGNLTVENCSFIDNWADHGGAIANKGILNITGSNFINNSAYYGGAIINDNFTITISNTTFINNTALSYGGAIYDYGIMEILNSTFIDNNATYGGGAIFDFYENNNKQNITISSSSFINNTAESGGAIYNNQNCILNIINTSFINNTGKGLDVGTGGGAIFNYNGGMVTITGSDCSFINNSARYDGGAIFNSNGGIINISSICSFILNNATYGGAIYNYQNGIISISGKNSTFINNTAESGGAIYNHNSLLNITVDNCSFINNTANSTSNGGGAIFNYNNGMVTITGNDCSFINNSATYDGGAIYNYNSITNISATCLFILNNATYGGAIYNSQNSIISISGKNSTFINNSADKYGGAIYSYNSLLNITGVNCSFINNSAKTSIGDMGGAIYNVYGNLNLLGDNCSFINNYATAGGAVFNGAGIVTISNAHFIRNNVTNNGGAIYNEENGHIYIYKSSFSNNKGEYGGAIYNYKTGIVTILNTTTFINNTGNYEAGAIYNEGNITISGANCSFINNNLTSSSGLGGAIYNFNPGVLIISGANSSFINNSANVGGAVFNEVGYVTISNAIFINNTANSTSYGGGAIYNDGLVNISGSSFVNNTAELGGAIYNHENSIINILGISTFINNNADSGGAIVNLGILNFTGSNCSFINNTANIGGAIINVGILNFTGVNYKFINNNATIFGAIYNNGNAHILNALFINNTAEYAGAIGSAEKGNLNISNVYFIKNNATKGGAIYNVIGNMSIYNSTFIKNNASIGGAIINVGGNSNISFSSFIKNSVDLNGSAIYSINYTEEDNASLLYNATLNVSYSVFFNNTGNYTIYSGNNSNVTALYNWWGSNNNPQNLVYGNINITKWVIMSLSLSSSSISAGSSSVLTVSLNKYYDNLSDLIYSLTNPIPTRTVSFYSTGGNLNPTNYNISGSVDSIYTAPSNGGTYILSANIDNQTLSVPITVSSQSTTNKTTIITNNELITVINGTVIVNILDEDSIVDTGSVNIFLDNKAISTAYVHNGKALLNITGLSSGNYSVNVFYFAKSPYSDTSKILTLTILENNKTKIKTVLTGNNLTMSYGAGLNYTGKLVDEYGNPVVGQHIALNLTRLSNGLSKVYWVTTDINGEYQLQINLGLGNYTAQAKYEGNENYTESNATLNSIKVVNNIPIKTVLTGNNLTMSYGAGLNFTGKLVDEYGNPVVGQHIAINLTRLSNGLSKVYWVTTDTSGEYQLQINLGLGNYTAQCSYSGTSKYEASNTSANITVL